MSRTMYWVTRDGSRRWVMLCEGTADEYHADTRNPLRIPACQAHVIVMTDSMPHFTSLRVDKGRIRRVRAANSQPTIRVT